MDAAVAVISDTGMLSLPIRKELQSLLGKARWQDDRGSQYGCITGEERSKSWVNGADIYGPNVPIMMGLEHLPPLIMRRSHPQKPMA
jgi:Mrp family chromosome partitioning ATPase